MVLSGTEQQTADALDLLPEVEAFAPMRLAWRRLPKHRRARMRCSHERVKYPLFRGYVFVMLSEQSAVSAVFRNKNVIGAVRTEHGLCYAKEEEMRRIISACRNGDYDDKRQLQRQTRRTAPDASLALQLSDYVGKTIKITKGALEGMVATVQSVDETGLMIGQTLSASIKVDFGNVELKN